MLAFEMLAVIKIMTVFILGYAGLLSIFNSMPIWPIYAIFGIMFGTIIISIIRMIRAK
jgi:hypothetical protein